MRSSSRIFSSIVGALVAAASVGCDDPKPGANAAALQASASAEHATPAAGEHAAPTALIGKALPAIALEGVAGEASTLHGVDGKPTVLVLWSTWCKSCLHETAQLTSWAQSRNDVAVLLVNVDGITGSPIDAKKVEGKARELGLSGPIWTAAAEDLPKLGVKTCPTSFIVDTHGVVQAARQGYKGADEMNQWLDTRLRAL